MRKRLHPHQVMDASELAFAVRYAFISAPRPLAACRDEDIRVTAIKMMVGVVSNTVTQASRRGWDLKERRRSQKGQFLAKLPLDSLLTVSPLQGAGGGGNRNRPGLARNPLFMTLHQDGWNSMTDTADRPTLVYWTEAADHSVLLGYGWDWADTYFGDFEPRTDYHCIVVPNVCWFGDPKLLAQGERPEPSGVYAASAPDFEAETRRRRDDAMRRRHGF